MDPPSYKVKDVVTIQAFVRGSLCRIRVSAMVAKMIEEIVAKRKKNDMDRTDHSMSSVGLRDRSAQGSVRNLMSSFEIKNETASPVSEKKSWPPRKKLTIPNSFLPKENQREEKEPEANQREEKEPEEEQPEEEKLEGKQDEPTKEEPVLAAPAKRIWPPKSEEETPPEKEESEEKISVTAKNERPSPVFSKRTWPPPARKNWSSAQKVEEKQPEEEEPEEKQPEEKEPAEKQPTEEEPEEKALDEKQEIPTKEEPKIVEETPLKDEGTKAEEPEEKEEVQVKKNPTSPVFLKRTWPPPPRKIWSNAHKVEEKQLEEKVPEEKE